MREKGKDRRERESLLRRERKAKEKKGQRDRREERK